MPHNQCKQAAPFQSLDAAYAAPLLQAL